ncbi:MAG: NAD(P)/FAD-dependent oxidoreductase [Desulfobacterales bacterium]
MKLNNPSNSTHVLIVGGGFAGLNTAKVLAGKGKVHVTLLDRNNYHLFQPLLYQVAMAGLNPSDIAVPIRSIFSRHKNIHVYKADVLSIDPQTKRVNTSLGTVPYHYLVMACGADKFYFGHEEWETNATALKSVREAIDIREKILTAFEKAEAEEDLEEREKLLTFVIVGGGSTGVEVAGALGEMCRYSMKRDFKNIDPRLARIFLLEAGPALLPGFPEKLSQSALDDLKSLAVQVKTSLKVTHIDAEGITTEKGKIPAQTVIWAAGIRASGLNLQLGGELDRIGRIYVQKDLSLQLHPDIFVAGDQAHFAQDGKHPLPAIAPVALQQGRFVGKAILREVTGNLRGEFHYHDKGSLATIGRSRAVLKKGDYEIGGFPAWLIWLFIHIYYLIGFKNKVFVFLQWAYFYISYKKGARLIVDQCDR